MGGKARRRAAGALALGGLAALAAGRAMQRSPGMGGTANPAAVPASGGGGQPAAGVAGAPPNYPRWFTAATEAVDRALGWDKLPLPLALTVLGGIRMRMRERNLYDTETPASRAAAAARLPAPDPRQVTARSDDGSYNDLGDPAMGANQARFGRNVPLADTFPEAEPAILSPNPRTVSNELLARREFIPATTLNLFAATWLQFMVHDWFSHGKNSKQHKWRIPLAEDDPFPQRPMEILHTRRDPSADRDPDRPPTYSNVVTHWWDASQLYGSDARTVARGRSGVDGKLTIGADGLLPVDPATGTAVAGVQGNWWFGLALMHHLFALEHNAVCDRLRADFPRWSDDDLFDHARLVIAALLAKIHTVEWTPAILGHPALQVAMRANWWGLEMERLSRLVGRLSDSEVISGIPGGPRDHFGVPYSITEEFVAVYRMHPLIPDAFSFRSHRDNQVLEVRQFPEVADRNARRLIEQLPFADLLYSVGTSHPGAITLRNFPNHLRLRREPDGSVIDLAAIDIMRSRERGVPRYNHFRRLVHRPPVRSFAELTDKPEWAEEIRRVYDGQIDRVDLSVGLFAEPLPQGFGFSDTAFRIFTVMASRRLNSDRFFTIDFNAHTYTQAGIDWIADNTFATVLTRHFPALAPSLRGVKNSFAPWTVATPAAAARPAQAGPVPDAYPVRGEGA